MLQISSLFKGEIVRVWKVGSYKLTLCFNFLQLIIRKLKEVDFDALSPSSECPADHLQKLKLAVPEV